MPVLISQSLVLFLLFMSSLQFNLTKQRRANTDTSSPLKTKQLRPHGMESLLIRRGAMAIGFERICWRQPKDKLSALHWHFGDILYSIFLCKSVSIPWNLLCVLWNSPSFPLVDSPGDKQNWTSSLPSICELPVDLPVTQLHIFRVSELLCC